MTVWINAPLRLGNNPQARTSAKGTAFATAFAFIDTGDKGTAAGLIAFGETFVAELTRYRKGDRLLIAGELTENNFVNAQGQPVEQLQIVVKSISGGKRQSALQEEIKPRRSQAEQP